MIRGESDLKYAGDGKIQVSTSLNTQFPIVFNDNKLGGAVPMRIITLRGVVKETNRQEGPSRRLSDAEFQARCEKELCFRCEEKFYAGHRCKVKDQKELSCSRKWGGIGSGRG